MKIGYARVSTREQSLDAQVRQLKQAGCERIFSEQVSAVARRAQWFALLDVVRPGDCVVVVRLDRIGRRMPELVSSVHELSELGVGVLALQQGIDTSGPSGRVLVTIFAALAETERDILRERTREGLAAAKARGRVAGRPRKLTPAVVEQIRHLRARGFSYREIGAACHMSAQSVLRALESDLKGEPRQPRLPL